MQNQSLKFYKLNLFISIFIFGFFFFGNFVMAGTASQNSAMVLHTSYINLSSTQLKAGSSGITLVSACGSNCVIVPINVFAKYNFVTPAYTGGSVFNFCGHTSACFSGALPSTFINYTANQESIMALPLSTGGIPILQGSNVYENQNFYVKFSAFSTGNGNLDLWFQYYTIDTSSLGVFYNLPLTFGTNNYLLGTNGSSAVSWVAPVSSLPWSSITSTPTTLSGYGITDSLVPSSRSLTINGTAYNLSADRSWTVTTSSLPWSSITSTPTTLSGYGITDSLVPSSRSLTINGTAYNLSADRSWLISSSGAFSLSPSIVYTSTPVSTVLNSSCVHSVDLVSIFSSSGTYLSSYSCSSSPASLSTYTGLDISSPSSYFFVECASGGSVTCVTSLSTSRASVDYVSEASFIVDSSFKAPLDYSDYLIVDLVVIFLLSVIVFRLFINRLFPKK